MNEEENTEFVVVSEQWWLARPEHLLVWARLQVMESGIAIIFDSAGELLTYESEDIARGMLMDADFRSFDGMDDDDAEEMGIWLDETEPPQGTELEDLMPQMIRTIGPKH
ncbi:MAG: hypothetical protein KA365_00405 [Arenimonas sp.]|nr:hypothetical protein [Arenimonas sp.]MBP6309082.1 hypothetical protein [Arenimonas sp.]